MPDIKSEVPELNGELTLRDDRKWWVIYTKSKREKKLAQYALRSNIYYYLPLLDSKKHYHRKMIVYKKPLFTCYFFADLNDKERQLLVESGHTVSFIRVEDQEQFVFELKQIRTVRESGAELVAHSYIEEGTRVRFKSGPMKDVEGIVTDAKNIKKVVLQVNILRRAIAVTSESGNLEILPEEYDDDEYCYDN